MVYRRQMPQVRNIKRRADITGLSMSLFNQAANAIAWGLIRWTVGLVILTAALTYWLAH